MVLCDPVAHVAFVRFRVGAADRDLFPWRSHRPARRLRRLAHRRPAPQREALDRRRHRDRRALPPARRRAPLQLTGLTRTCRSPASSAAPPSASSSVSTPAASAPATSGACCASSKLGGGGAGGRRGGGGGGAKPMPAQTMDLLVRFDEAMPVKEAKVKYRMGESTEVPADFQQYLDEAQDYYVVSVEGLHRCLPA